MGKRRQAREISLQALYQIDIRKIKPEEVWPDICHFSSLEKDVQKFSEILVKGTFEKLPEIDNIISKNSLHWNLERMAIVDRNILRLASYEILFCEDIPFAVSINEAIELAKTYGTEESGKFVNGILNKIKEEAEKMGVKKTVVSSQ